MTAMEQKQPENLLFFKGHGTENDFVILPDYAAQLVLNASLVAAICNRHSGIGADGLLRVAAAGALLEAGAIDQLPTGVQPDDWFMDYYNADGSIAEMCGNGARVFAHYVYAEGIAKGEQFVIGTRAGAKPVTVHSCTGDSAEISVDMGPATVTGVSTCEIGEKSFAGMGVDMGNPHLACVVPSLTPAELAELNLEKPIFDTEFFPEGVNVEIVTELDTSTEVPRAHMRVYERGVGETRSCGTGTVAAARAVLADAGHTEGEVDIVIPGGMVKVTITPEGSTLTGPSKIITEGMIRPVALTG